MEQRVKVTPITKRAKDRVGQHGEYMILLKVRDGRVLLRSERRTWRREYWVGWFDNHREVEIIDVGPVQTGPVQTS